MKRTQFFRSMSKCICKKKVQCYQNKNVYKLNIMIIYFLKKSIFLSICLFHLFWTGKFIYLFSQNGIFLKYFGPEGKDIGVWLICFLVKVLLDWIPSLFVDLPVRHLLSTEFYCLRRVCFSKPWIIARKAHRYYRFFSSCLFIWGGTYNTIVD